MRDGLLSRILLLGLMIGLFFAFTACEEDSNEESDDAPVSPFVSQVRDTPFYQEMRDEFLRGDIEGYYSDTKQSPNAINGIAVTADAVYAATDLGLLAWQNDVWETLVADRVFRRLLAADDTLYAATDDAVLVLKAGLPQEEWPLAVAGRIRALALVDGRLHAGGDAGLFVARNQQLEAVADLAGRRVYDLAPDSAGQLWVATGQGLLLVVDGEATAQWTTAQYLFSDTVRALAFDDEGRLWIGTTAGLNTLEPDGFISGYTGRQGLPILAINRLAFRASGPEAGLWIGSSWGAIRYDGAAWNYYAGRRWLPDNVVTDLTFGDDGPWLATGNGVSRLRFATTTLADKAAHYQEINRARHDRYGLVAPCDLDLPGNLATFRPKESDNDGLATSLYVAALAFQYAVTGDAQIKTLADKHFAALTLLHDVTGIPGLVARSIAPLYSKSSDPTCAPFCDWQANPELGYDWKSDTGSDEITGHFFAYTVYFDLVADKAGRAEVRKRVANLMDYLIDNDYFLIDWDGKPTTWGIWNPSFLWEWYKLLGYGPSALQYAGPVLANSLELLAFLQTAIHITGETRFTAAYERLLADHALDDLAVNAAVYFPMVTNHGALELLYLSYYSLLRYESDEARLEKYHYSLQRAWEYTRIENNSLFNTIYGALTAGQADFGLPQAIATLQNIPFDLLDWSMQNSQRDDVTIDPFPNQYWKTLSDTSQPPLPPDERVISPWDRDPFVLDDGGYGMSEEAGTYWLLPYWMARYHGFIR